MRAPFALALIVAALQLFTLAWLAWDGRNRR